MALVHYKEKNILGVGTKGGQLVRLLPGVNEVEDSLFNEVKAHPLFQARVKSGKVQILVDNIGKDGKRSVEDMLSLIPQMVDTKLLKKIIDTDGRERVIALAKEQLDKIKNPSKDKEEHDEHFR